MIYLYTPNDPIVESSSNLTFAPYNLKYNLLKEHAVKADLIGTFVDDDGVTQNKVNKWNLIFDFTKSDTGSNFKLLSPTDFGIQEMDKIIDS